MNKITDYIYRAFYSTKLFVATLVLLAVNSLWMVFSAIYPLPFDEYVHMGIIQIYARQWSPFIATQPPGTGLYGDVTREPSILYYWLLSFPYRVLDHFIENPNYLIVCMRLISVACMIGTVILFRKLLLKWGVSRRVTHLVLLAFVMTPIVPFLAAHVNYDNLMLLLTPIFLLLATDLMKSNKNLVKNTMLFLLVAITTVLVKQPFLPLAAVVTAYVSFVVWHRNRSELPGVIKKSWIQTSKILVAACCVGFLGTGYIVAERYVGNLTQYGSLTPRCEAVQPKSVCRDFGPWYRDNIAHTRPKKPPYANITGFIHRWLDQIMRGYYAIFAHVPTRVTNDHEPYGPIQARNALPMLLATGCIIVIIGLIAVAYKFKAIWQNMYLRFGLVISGFYMLVIWSFNYRTYLRIWRASAIQARYTLPVLIIMLAIMAVAINWSISSKKIKSGMVLLFLAVYVYGGGAAGWFLRSNNYWLWQNPTVLKVNSQLRDGLNKVIPH